MSKFDYRRLSSSQQRRLLADVAAIIAALKNQSEIERFLQQLLTPSETVMLARRLQTAQALVEGKTYATIREELGVGQSTIQLIDRWLKGVVGDYHGFSRAYYKRLHQRSRKVSSHQQRSHMPDSLGSVRHRYPGHFLLLNLLLDGLGK